MIIDNPKISGSLEVQNHISASDGTITGDLTVQGTVIGTTSTASYIAAANVDGLTNISSSLASETLKNTTDTLTGDLTVTGNITAQEFHTEFISASIIYESGSTKFGDSQDDTHNFTGSVNITGSLNVNGQEVGTGKLDETVFNSYTSSTDTKIDNLTGATSSYAIKTDISGSFTSTSASIAGDIEDILDGTDTVTSASYALTASYADSGAGFPFVGAAIITGSLYVSGSTVSGSFVGDGSQLTGIDVSAVSSVTSSFSAVSTLTINHNFNSKNVSVAVYNSSDVQVLPAAVTLTDNDNVKIDFAGNTAGYAVVSKGGHIVSGSLSISETGHISDSFTSQTSHTVFHGFNTKEVIVSVYENDSLIIPDTITTPNLSSVTVTFPEAISGRVVVVKGGHLISGSIPFANITNKPTLLSGSAQIASDISGSFTPLSSSLESRVSDQESFSSSLDATFATDADLNLVSSSVDSLNAATSSYALANQISGSFTSLSSSIASELLKNTTDTLTGDLTVTGTLTAQDLHVQEVTSSVVFSSGSNKFGALSTDTQKFTGSLEVNGSSHHLLGDVGIGTAGPETALHLYTSGTSNKQLMIDQGSTGDAVMSFRLAGVSEYVMGIDNSDSDKFKIANSGNVGTSTLLTIDSSGNVGIGTNSPDAKLHIYGSTSLSEMYLGEDAAADKAGILKYTQGNGTGTGVITLSHWGNTSTTQSLAIKYGGNVGIGTTSPASKLEVYGGNSGTNDVDRYVRFKASNGEKRFDFYMGGTGNASSLGMYTSDGTTKNIQISAGGTSYFNAGNVGIGETSPSAKLQVVGTTGLPATSGTAFTGTMRLNVSGYGTVLDFGSVGPATGTQWLQATDKADLSITYPLLLNPNGGNVGIGTTSPAQNLHVIGNIYSVNSGTDGGQIRLANSGGGSNWYWAARTTGLNLGELGAADGRMFIANGGNVGIGEINPLGKLHVKTSDTGVTTPSAQGNLLVLEDSENGLSILSSTAGAGYINFGDSDDNNIGMIIYGHSTNSMDFWTNASKRMTIDSGGDIGIGTATPRGDLHLYGGQQNIVLTNTNADGVAGLTISRIIGQARGYSNTSSVMQSIDFETNSSTWYKGDIVFKTNSIDGTDSSVAASERMRITSDGDISLNGGILGLGRASSTPTIGYGMFHYSGIGLGIYSGAGGGTQGIGFWLNNGSAYEAGRWLQNGNLGIGETAPAAKLQVSGDRDGNSEYVAILGEDGGANGAANSGNTTPVHKTLLTGYSIPYSGQTNARLTSVGFLEFDSTPGWTGNQRNYALTSGYDMGGTGGPKFAILMGDTQNVEPQLGTNGAVGTGAGANTRVCSYWDNGGNMTIPEGGLSVNGLLGIGTGAPSRELDIQASSGWAEIALRGNTGGGGSLEFWTNTTKRAEIFADTEDIVFRNTASNKERLRIDSNGIMYIMGATASTNNSLQMQYNSTAGTAEIYSKSTAGNTSFEFYASNAGTTNKVVTFDKEGIITSKTNNGAYTATHLRTISIPFSGSGTFTFDIDPVATFGTRLSGGRMKLEVSGWGTRMNAGYIVYRNDGTGSGKIGTGDVVYYRYAWSETSGTQAMVAVSLPSSTTNVVRISFSGWHSNDHGFEARLTATS